MELPSKIVLIRGNPKARVLWDATNMAATVSFLVNPNIGSENVLNRTPSDMACMTGISVNRARVCCRLRPRPVLNALQKAFQTMPKRMIWDKWIQRDTSHIIGREQIEPQAVLTSCIRLKNFEFFVYKSFAPAWRRTCPTAVETTYINWKEL